MSFAVRMPKFWLITCALVGMGQLRGAPARACTYGIPNIQATFPAEGATDVPTNAVLFVYGDELASAGDVLLVDANDDLVPVDVQPVNPSGFDLTPHRELAPHQAYWLRRAGSFGLGIEFTTGAGPAAVPAHLEKPAPDSAALNVRLLEYSYGSCEEQTGICFDASPALGTTLEVRAGEEVINGTAPWPWYRLFSQEVAEDECIEVRARDVRGNRSEPLRVCGDDLRRVRLRADQYDVVYTCDNYANYVVSDSFVTSDVAHEAVISDSVASGSVASDNVTEPSATSASNGCALGGAGAARSSWGWVVASVAAALMSFRRRRVAAAGT